MNFNNIHDHDDPLDQLFQQARNQAPKRSFADTKSVFAGALALGVATAAHAKAMTGVLFKSKFIIMSISTASIITTSALIYSTLQPLSTVKHETVLHNKNPKTETKENTVRPKQVSDETFVFAAPTENSSEMPFLKIKKNKAMNHTLPVEKATLYSKDSFPKTEGTGNIRYNYTLTERTTREELERIKMQAKESGVRFSYSAKIRRGEIKNLKFTLRDESGSTFRKVHISSLFSKLNFSYDLSWTIDENGRMLGCGEEDASSTEYRHPSDTELAELDAEMARQDAVFALQDTKFDQMDILLKKVDALVEESNKKVDLLVAASESEIKWTLKRDKKSRKGYKESNGSVHDQEIEAKIEHYRKETEVYDADIRRINDQLDALNTEIEQISAEIEALNPYLDVEVYYDAAIDTQEETEIHTDVNTPVVTRASEEPLTQINLLITNKTTPDELADIQKTALAAGIDFTYTARFKNDRIKNLHLEMKISDQNGITKMNAHKIAARKNEMFSFAVIWRQDANGQAVDFCKSNQIETL